MTIKVLFVDLGNTLILSDIKQIYEKFEKEKNLPVELLRRVICFEHAKQRTKNEVNEFLQQIGINTQIYEEFRRELYNSEKRNENLIKLLEEICQNGIVIVLTTNNSDHLESILEKYKINYLFDLIINSSQAEVMKPNLSYWIYAFDQAKNLLPELQPKEILVIDDNPDNCLSAQKFGMNSFQYLNEPGSEEKILTIIKYT